jgi:hypothetical protein
MSEIANRPEPPRMNRRHKVFRKWGLTSIDAWQKIATIAEALRYARLVAELDVNGDEVELYAARRVKGGKKE